jgi:hypothetical protein
MKLPIGEPHRAAEKLQLRQGGLARQSKVENATTGLRNYQR